MKVAHNTQIEYETRIALDKYCKKSGESIAQVTNDAIAEYLLKKNEVQQPSG